MATAWGRLDEPCEAGRRRSDAAWPTFSPQGEREARLSSSLASRRPTIVTEVGLVHLGVHANTNERSGRLARVSETPPKANASADADHWLLLIYRIPSEPSRLRAAVWRRLKSLGAVYVQNSVAALPAGEREERALRKLRREILDMNGTGVLMSCSALVGGHSILALFQAARDSEYEEILDKCQDFHAGLDKEYVANHFTYGELEENEVELVKLRNWYAKVLARDVFGASAQGAAREALEACAQAMETYAARVYLEDGDGA
jgi:hypothetical protein